MFSRAAAKRSSQTRRVARVRKHHVVWGDANGDAACLRISGDRSLTQMISATNHAPRISGRWRDPPSFIPHPQVGRPLGAHQDLTYTTWLSRTELHPEDPDPCWLFKLVNPTADGTAAAAAAYWNRAEGAVGRRISALGSRRAQRPSRARRSGSASRTRSPGTFPICLKMHWV